MIKTLQNKPKVFLSHSKKDIEFIHRLCKDLSLCQIEPWLDSQEIRHGQPWLDAIFESGIPTCDAILVYLTESSIESPMVKKEMDVSIIKKLKESHVAFLPYVSQEILRDQLRMDIQVLQTPVWNSANYFEMLPRVVAEIWHSYLDSVVVSVANEEKVRRLEAELELEKLRKTGMESIFEAREIADFDFIWKQFDYKEAIEFRYVKYDHEGIESITNRYEFSVQIQTIIPFLDKIADGVSKYPHFSFQKIFRDLFKDHLPKIREGDRIQQRLDWRSLPDLMNKLKMYGLIKMVQKTDKDFGEYNSEMTTEKLDRFKYWLYHEGILPNEIKWEKN